MTSDEVISLFKETGALLEGHFVLSSGLHSSVYLQCAIALQETRNAIEFGAAIANHFRDHGIDTVASPAIGGLVIGYEVARQLRVRFIWTEREQGTMTLRRGFTINHGERVLVVEDVITTGGSTRDTIEALRTAGADVIAAASIIDRSGGRADVGVPRVSLATLDPPSAATDECDACKRGESAIKPGSRKSVSGEQ
ncbi:MAG TPA: orotate phosphoribosyltransferase [Pyrinomonadaceae bacterium]|jgi:orotate phosphoribosyltransferase|nr:orotate phosphoribosyltransferase [Pyrinomonadaceae bacterium]